MILHNTWIFVAKNVFGDVTPDCITKKCANLLMVWGVHIFCSVKVTTLENKSLSITGRSLSLHHRMRIRMPLQRIPITRLLRRPHRNCSRCQPRTLAHGQLRSRPYQGYPFPWWIRSRQRALRCSWQGRRRKYLILRATIIKERLLECRFFPSDL